MKNLLLVLLSGIILVLSMYPISFSAFIWVGLVPFLYVILTNKFEHKKFLRIEFTSPAIRGFILGSIFYYGTLYWLYGVLGFSGLALLLILCLYLYAYAFILRIFLDRWPSIYAQMFLPATLWLAIEFFKSAGWRLKFTWMNLGYSQYNNPYLLQFASIGGQFGITFMIIFVNTLVTLMIIHRKNKRFVFAMFGLILSLFGAMRTRGYVQSQKSFEADISVGMVQYEPKNEDLSPIDVYDDLFLTLPKGLDFIIFPEYTVPDFLLETVYEQDMVQSWMEKSGAYVVLGSEYREDLTKEEYYNTAFLFDPEGENIGRFYKMNPVQFFKDGIPGKEYNVFETEHGIVGIMICYDMNYTKVSRNLVANGAEILFIPTFDARHWGELQHNQHATMTSIRAVENGRYLVRVASSGISQVFDPLGNEITRIGFDEIGVNISSVKFISEKTIYNRFGWLFPYLCSLISVILLAIIGFEILKLKIKNKSLPFVHKAK